MVFACCLEAAMPNDDPDVMIKNKFAVRRRVNLVLGILKLPDTNVD